MEAMEKKEDRTNEEQRPYSILDAIVEASKENEGFPKRTILPNLWTFFIAGHDTTATSLAWLIHELAKSPQIQEKIREEAELVLGKMEKAPSLADLESLPYLDAVLKENLRMHPPIHNLFTRGAAEDTSLGGYAVPAGTPVSIAISAVNRHPVSWESPNDFRPERFIEDENRKFKLFSWMPFSVGPRRCIGEKFSLIEQKCLIAKVLLEYEIVQSKDSEEVQLSRSTLSFMLKEPTKFHVRFVPRS